jgi:heme exporter protein D
MIWTSASEFFAMGGYGLYVWGSYGLALLLMGLEPMLAARRRRQALRDARAAELWADDAAPPAR